MLFSSRARPVKSILTENMKGLNPAIQLAHLSRSLNVSDMRYAFESSVDNASDARVTIFVCAFLVPCIIFIFATATGRNVIWNRLFQNTTAPLY